MATRSLGQLTLDLVARTGGWQRGMDASERRTQRWRRQVQSELRKAGTAFAGLATAAAAGLGAAVLQTTNSAREIEILARLADTSTQQFQRMAFGAERFGIDQEKLSGILKDTTDRVGDFIATGGGPMADFFENIAPKVGVTAEQFARLSGPEALQLYVNSLQEAGVSQAEMTFYMEALASDAAALVPLLANDGEEMRRLGEEAERTGNVFSELEFEQLEAIRDGMDELAAAAAGMKNQVVLGALPAVEDFIDLMSDPETMESAQAFGNAIVTAMGWAIEAIRETTTFVQDLATEMGVVATGIGGLELEEQRRRIMDALESPSQRLRFFGPGGIVEYFSEEELLAELFRINRMIQDNAARFRISGESEDGDSGGDSGAGQVAEDAVLLASGLNLASEAAVEFAKLLEEFSPAVNENVEDILERAGPDASIDADGVLRDAFGNALPTLQRELAAELRDQLTDFQNQQNLSEGLMAAVEVFVTGANEAARQAWESLSPDAAPEASDGESSTSTGGGRASIEWSRRGDLPGLSRLDRSAREASAESGGRNLGTLRLTNDRGDSVEVEGERDNLTKWLADTLSSAAGSVD